MEPLCAVGYEVTIEDVVAVHLRSLRESPFVRDAYRRTLRNAMVTAVVVAAVGAGIGYLNAETHEAGLRRAGSWVAIYALIATLSALVWLRPGSFSRRVERIAEKTVRSGKVPVALGPWEIRLWPDRIETVESNGSFAKPWSTVREVSDEADGVYIIFIEGGLARVASRAFASPAEREEFIALCHERIADTTALA